MDFGTGEDSARALAIHDGRILAAGVIYIAAGAGPLPAVALAPTGAPSTRPDGARASRRGNRVRGGMVLMAPWPYYL